MNNLLFGYPESCNLCNESKNCSEKGLVLNVEPFFQIGNDIRLMLIGQDPTIFDKPERVKQVLMLDEGDKKGEKKGQLRVWLEHLFGKEKFDNFTIYATNIVKCTFPKPPSQYKGKKFLEPYFENCKLYLIEEVKNFKPTIVFTFGEPSHKFFSSIFEQGSEKVHYDMKKAFTGQFYNVIINGHSFKYTPCLHIKTYRVAETYGKGIETFKEKVKTEFN